MIEAHGLHKVAGLVTIVVDEVDERVPEMARQVLKVIVNQLKDIQTGIADLEKQVLVWHKNNPVSQRLATIPGIGPIIATAIAATIADPNIFRSGREFAAWLGLVPRQNSTGGKARLGGISKRGDSYLRRLLVNSAHTVLLCSKQAKTDPWLISLLSRKPRLVAAVALANKTARVAWAIMSRHHTYRHVAAAASLAEAARCRKLARVNNVMAHSVTRRRPKGRTHDCKRPVFLTKKALASWGPSTHEAAALS